MTSPTRPSRRRRAAALALTGLLATVVPLGVGVAAPTSAAAACTSEVYQYAQADVLRLAPFGCDDVTPPDTQITGTAPALSGLGYTRSSSIVISFRGVHTDADTDAISFECTLSNSVNEPGDSAWQPCTSPQAYSGLEETTSTPYTFRVRALDSVDDDIAACDANGNPLQPVCVGEEVIEDVDATPASITIGVDTIAPNTFLSREPVDDIRPDRPVVLTPRPGLVLNSNEAAAYACTLNGTSFRPCVEGLNTLTGLRVGDNTFVARAVDKAGNLDPTAASTRFFLPRNIRTKKGSAWSTKRQPGLFGNDFVTADEVGETLVIKGIRNVTEVRLLAPTGPRFGKVEVRVGSSQWYKVDLHSKKPRRLAQLLVRDEFSPAQTGRILVRVASLRGKRSTVRLDALVARR